MKKAVSPLVAVVLLIALVLVSASLISSWYVNFLKTQRERVGEQTSTKIECYYGGIRVLTDTIECNFSGSDDYLNFTVENSGNVDLYDLWVEIYIGGKVYSFVLKDSLTDKNFTSSYPLRPGRSASVYAVVTQDLPGGVIEWMRVTTQCSSVDSGRIPWVDCS